MSGPPRQPTYALCIIKEHIKANRYRVTERAVQDAAALYLDEADIVDCVLALDESCFYKTMPSERRPGLMQDVYKTRYLGIRIYVKLQIADFKGAVVISFKRDESL